MTIRPRSEVVELLGFEHIHFLHQLLLPLDLELIFQELKMKMKSLWKYPARSAKLLHQDQVRRIVRLIRLQLKEIHLALPKVRGIVSLLQTLQLLGTHQLPVLLLVVGELLPLFVIEHLVELVMGPSMVAGTAAVAAAGPKEQAEGEQCCLVRRSVP